MIGRNRWLVVLAAVVLVAGAVVVWVVTRDGYGDLRATASSSATGHPAREVLGGGGWRSDEETVGAWILLDWSGSTDVRRVVLERSPVDDRGIRAGYLTFDNGSQVQVRFAEGTRTVTVPVTARSVGAVRLTVSEVDDGATSVGLTRFGVDGGSEGDNAAQVDSAASPDGNVATAATVTASRAAGLVEAPALVDGTDAPATITDPDGAWVQLDWARPRELTTIAVTGVAGGATLTSSTLEFADGATVALGEVLADPDRPTVVSFMPRVTTSVRLIVDSVGTAGGSGPLEVAEVAAYQPGAPPRQPSGTGGTLVTGTESGDDDCPTTGPDPVVGLVVLCPTNGTAVGDQTTLTVAAAPAAVVRATAWSADEASEAGATVEGTADADGLIRLDLDVGDLAPGPFTVELVANVGGASVAERYLQLDRGGTVTTVQPPPGPTGRSLVYEDDFDGPLSVSRTGDDADYAAGKPVVDGVQDFGDVPFGDPDGGLDNVGIEHDDYLRLSTRPVPEASAAEGETVGALLASARPGGSGFSAQYGYFEARMLAPAAPGTWPAFWVLPSPNLVSDQPYVAEFDAVELYGHNPTGACHSTHQYPDPDEVGVANCGERWDSARAALAWHTYGVAVEPTSVTFFIDGRQVAEAPQVKGGDEPLFFLVDLALGGGWPVDLSATRDRADLYVDWVRVYV